MNNTDHKASKQMIRDINNLIRRYAKRVEKDGYYNIDYVLSIAVSSPEECLEGSNFISTDNFVIADALIQDLNRNNVASLLSEGTTMCEFFKRYKK